MYPVPASTVRAALAGLAAVGAEPAPLLARAGLPRAALDVPGGAVPLAAFAAVWRAAAEADPDPALPLRVGLATPPGALPLLEGLVDTAPTLGAAFATLEERFYLASAAVAVEVAGGTLGVPTEARFATRGGLPRLAPVEAWAATLALARLRLAVGEGGPAAVARVLLPPSVVPDAPAGARAAGLLGVPADGADRTALVLAPGALDVPLRSADAGARALLESAAAGLGVSAQATEPLAVAVRRALPAALAEGAFGVADVAARLGFAERSLQRRLAAEGTSFAALLDGHRRDEARRLLAGTGLAVADVAAALGYAEQAALTRAFRRWEGVSPVRWRRGRELP